MLLKLIVKTHIFSFNMIISVYSQISWYFQAFENNISLWKYSLVSLISKKLIHVSWKACSVCIMYRTSPEWKHIRNYVNIFSNHFFLFSLMQIMVDAIKYFISWKLISNSSILHLAAISKQISQLFIINLARLSRVIRKSIENIFSIWIFCRTLSSILIVII